MYDASVAQCLQKLCMSYSCVRIQNLKLVNKHQPLSSINLLEEQAFGMYTVTSTLNQ